MIQVGELTHAIVTIDGKQIKIPADKAREVHRQLDLFLGEKEFTYVTRDPNYIPDYTDSCIPSQSTPWPHYTVPIY